MSEVTTRRCREDDFPEVFGLLKQLYPDQLLDKDKLNRVYTRALHSRNELYDCAVEDKKVVGFCSIWIKESLWQAGGLAYIGEMVVDEDIRGQGIGTLLLENAYLQAKSRSCRRIELDSGFARKEAHHFYESAGFEKRAFVFSKEI
jgi:glucosamine-phosphate N-acetyltransferase